MSPDNKVLWLTFHEACKNPAPAPARQIISCIRLIELDTDASPIGAARAAIKFDFDLAERNMDLYYPTLTFTGSRAQGTNNMPTRKKDGSILYVQGIKSMMQLTEKIVVRG